MAKTIEFTKVSGVNVSTTEDVLRIIMPMCATACMALNDAAGEEGEPEEVTAHREEARARFRGGLPAAVAISKFV